MSIAVVITGDDATIVAGCAVRGGMDTHTAPWLGYLVGVTPAGVPAPISAVTADRITSAVVTMNV